MEMLVDYNGSPVVTKSMMKEKAIIELMDHFNEIKEIFYNGFYLDNNFMKPASTEALKEESLYCLSSEVIDDKNDVKLLSKYLTRSEDALFNGKYILNLSIIDEYEPYFDDQELNHLLKYSMNLAKKYLDDDNLHLKHFNILNNKLYFK